jgi:hypothetical protein
MELRCMEAQVPRSHHYVHLNSTHRDIGILTVDAAQAESIERDLRDPQVGVIIIRDPKNESKTWVVPKHQVVAIENVTF